jgi:hypothetical protein
MLRPMIDAQRVAIAEIEAWWPDINREPIYSPNMELSNKEPNAPNQGLPRERQ